MGMSEPKCRNGHPLSWFNIDLGPGLCRCLTCGARTRADAPNLYDRLWAQAQPIPITGCWLWTGTTDRDGYGQIGVAGKKRRAHKVAYQLAGGIIPHGLVLDHLCRTRSCIAPEHLEPVHPDMNTARGVSPAGIVLATRFCQRGHEVSGENELICGRHRQCRACFRITNRAAVARYRARKLARLSGMPEMTDEQKAALYGRNRNDESAEVAA